MAAGQQHNAASSFSKINHGKLDENVLDRAQLNYPVAPAGILYLSSGELLQVSRPDRKSTRLNSSHRCISYAVFCLKKKKPQYAEAAPVAPGYRQTYGPQPRASC